MYLLQNKCPCYTCWQRHVNCHATCKAYLCWRAALDKQNKAINREKEKEYSLYTVSPRLKSYNKKEI